MQQYNNSPVVIVSSPIYLNKSVCFHFIFQITSRRLDALVAIKE